jgi:hypothetical protein
MTISSAATMIITNINREVDPRLKEISIDTKKTQDSNAKGKINRTWTIKEQKLAHH